jgi:hypothetical protein
VNTLLSSAVDPGWVPTKMAAPQQLAIWKWAIAPRHGSPSATTQPRSGALLPASMVAIFGQRQRRRTLEELAR